MKPVLGVSVLWILCTTLTCAAVDRREERGICLLSKLANRRPPKSVKVKKRRPWEINQNLCPPVLCPLTLKARGIDDDLSISLHSRRSFQFFEGDIVLDRDMKERVIDKKTVRKRRRRLQKRFQRDVHLRRFVDRLRTPDVRLEEKKWRRVRNGVRRRRLDGVERNRKLRRQRRGVVIPRRRFWKDAVVPYEFDERVDEHVREVIKLAFRHYERRTCIQFRPKTDQDTDYILYMRQPGCWSTVGVKGGMQVISIGAGCEQLGTILHETGHALGFWHEQSRPDRDKYVKVVKKNIPDMMLEQFSKRTVNESDPRGYAYDYLSIMHYGAEYFSMNERRTLRVIKIGKKHRFKIGQRKGLSDLDVAQLRDMYRCNERVTPDKKCDEGWVQYENSCYKFIPDAPTQFNTARSKCARLGAHLVHLDTSAESEFVTSYLLEYYAHIDTWRTGGKLVNKRFMWFSGKNLVNRIVDVRSLWCSGHPGRYNTMALGLLPSAQGRRFQWRGVWAGSAKAPQNYAYAYICERRPRGPCFKSTTGDGRDYRDSLDYSEDGITCQEWTSSYPHNHTTMTGNVQLDVQYGIGPHNYCRNPAGRRSRPWCYVLLGKISWQYCDIQICA